ncbi:MAG TPA: hypothetical protein IAA58_03190 [Candidatus Gallacutalibacter stercoravium]|nr:hypothetical protein [Candidatus Gallacutalibacter stercoravium]
MIKNTLPLTGNLYKGNLHTHTTLSDGRFSPEDTAELYRKNGYSFLALTDHRLYGIHQELNRDDFLIMPGTELDVDTDVDFHHIVSIGCPDSNTYPHGKRFQKEKLDAMGLQQTIDDINAHNNIAIYAHPYWSRVKFDAILSLQNVTGMEIFNYGCEREWRCGNSEVFYDHYLWNQNYMWCFSTDDAHSALSLPDDGGGYITVKCDSLTHQNIFDALKSGSFYASAAEKGSEAPVIENFYVEDGVAKIWCSPCRSVFFNSKGNFFPTHATEKGPITYVEWKLPQNAPYVRAICVDFNGFSSWTQPIVL